MSAGQNYIGIPNGAVLCIDSTKGETFEGRLYHRLSDGIKVNNLIVLMDELEVLMNKMGFPRPTTDTRSFTDMMREADNIPAPYPNVSYLMSDEDLLSKHGDKATFIIRVQQRQNTTWQGRITWCEKEQTVVFNSIWEMLKLLENAMYMDGKKGDTDSRSWED